MACWWICLFVNLFLKDIVLPAPTGTPLQNSFAKIQQLGTMGISAREEFPLLNCHFLNASCCGESKPYIGHILLCVHVMKSLLGHSLSGHIVPCCMPRWVSPLCVKELCERINRQGRRWVLSDLTCWSPTSLLQPHHVIEAKNINSLFCRNTFCKN